MKSKILNYYSDPGHGWVKVSKDFLVKMEISEKISIFSYQKSNFAYLEEDCDLSLLIQSMKQKNIQPIIRQYNTNKSSKIRSYDRYIVA